MGGRAPGEEEKEKQVHHLLRRLQTSPPSLPYPAILRRLLNKKKETHFLLYHASKQKNTTTIISERSSAFFCVLVKLVDCTDASCERPMAMSQMTPTILQHYLQAWVFSFPSRARNERVRTRGDVRRW